MPKAGRLSRTVGARCPGQKSWTSQGAQWVGAGAESEPKELGVKLRGGERSAALWGDTGFMTPGLGWGQKLQVGST